MCLRFACYTFTHTARCSYDGAILDARSVRRKDGRSDGRMSRLSATEWQHRKREETSQSQQASQKGGLAQIRMTSASASAAAAATALAVEAYMGCLFILCYGQSLAMGSAHHSWSAIATYVHYYQRKAEVICSRMQK